MLLSYDAFVQDAVDLIASTHYSRGKTRDELKETAGLIDLSPSELEKTLRRLKTSGTIAAAVRADESMPIMRLEWSAIAP